MSLDTDWRAESATLLDNLTAARQAAADASDDVDRRLHLSFAHDAAARLSWLLELTLMDLWGDNEGAW